MRGLIYLHSDKTTMKAWLHRIGKVEYTTCVFGVAQNAAHLWK